MAAPDASSADQGTSLISRPRSGADGENTLPEILPNEPDWRQGRDGSPGRPGTAQIFSSNAPYSPDILDP